MLNGWDVAAIIVVGFLIMGIVGKISQAIVAAKAVKQCAAIGVSEKEFYEKVDKIIEKAIYHAQTEILKKAAELDKKSIKDTIKLVDAESKKVALEIKKMGDQLRDIGASINETDKKVEKKTPVKRATKKKTTKE